MKNEKLIVPPATLLRLPLYYKTLQQLDNNDKVITSTIELAEILNTKPEQIRKDLSTLGNFGVKGVGYDVIKLKLQIGNILGLQNYWRLAIIGVGNLGAALANYEKITDWGFVVAALFDID
jgi:redox-sensing transcriptional repressor